MVCKEKNIPRKLEIARQTYNFAKEKRLSDLIEGLEISKEDINLKRETIISSDAIITYTFKTEKRGKYEELILGRLYFSDNENGEQSFLFKLEGFPPILQDTVKKFIRSDEFPGMTLESSNYASPYQKNFYVHSARKCANGIRNELVFRDLCPKGNGKNIGNI